MVRLYDMYLSETHVFGLVPGILPVDCPYNYPMTSKSWKTRSRKPLLSFGKWLTVESHTVELPNGKVIDDWAWVTSPDFVNVLAQMEDGRFLMFRQGKYGLEGESLAPVGGYCEPGEEPLAAAQRELLEETGHTAASWTDLGTFRVDPNRGVCMGTLFLAQGARKIADPTADDLEEQQIVSLTMDELERELLAGQVKSMAWMANVALALVYLRSGGKS